MKKTKLSALILCAVMAITCFAGCNKKEVANDDKTLQIYAIEAGYGVEWLHKVAAAFESEYPEYDVVIESEQGVSRVENMLVAGPDNTTHDLFFTNEKLAKLQAAGPNALKGYDCVLENLTDMYESKVFGEEVTLKDKTDDYILDMYAVEEENADGEWEDNYYMYCWANSLMGMVYNKTLFAEKSVSVPRTTEELYDVCDTLKSSIAPTIGTFAVSYMGAVATTWWAQYEGQDEYNRYWNPTSLNDYETMSQKGKLYQLQIQNQLYKKSYGRLHKDAIDANYTESQAKFITREAAMLFCGDWFENEMKSLIAQNKAAGNNDEYGMMKMPINSAVVEKLSFWDKNVNYSDVFMAARGDSPNSAKLQQLKSADEKLTQIIDYVDGKTSAKPDFATDKDIEIVREARNIVITYGAGQQAVIPTYATAKEAAKKFLLFLSSEQGQEIFAENTSGATMPYGYDPEKDNIEMTDFAKDAKKILQEAVICPHGTMTKGDWLVGLKGVRITVSRLASDNDYVTPEYMYTDSIISLNEYTSLLKMAGII